LERRPPWPTAKSSRTLAERALKSHETRKEMHGEREGTTASSPRAKNGGGDGSETTATRTARTVVGGAPPCGSCGRDEAKMERGQQEGARGGLGCLLTRPRERGRAHDARRGGGSALTGSGRWTREVGGGADRWGPGVSGWARQLPGAGDAEARGCWAGREAGPSRGGKASWAAGCGAGPREGTGPAERRKTSGPNLRKGGNGRKFSFFFL